MTVKPSPGYIAMPDSITVADLPSGYDAYLGYADGRWPTALALAERFPAARLVILTVTGEAVGAHGARVSSGADSEPGDLTAAQAVSWARDGRFPVARPVIYASTAGAAGYGMPSVLRTLELAGIGRQEVRLLSAHYGAGPHICGPGSCGLIGTDMDGTQWTNTWASASGRNIDMSMLADDFFDPPQSETERLVTELGIVRQGDIGPIVRTVQGLCCARGTGITVDGVFGANTASAVRYLQNKAKLTADGVVGPLTWPVLLGVA